MWSFRYDITFNIEPSSMTLCCWSSKYKQMWLHRIKKCLHCKRKKCKIVPHSSIYHLELVYLHWLEWPMQKKAVFWIVLLYFLHHPHFFFFFHISSTPYVGIYVKHISLYVSIYVKHIYLYVFCLPDPCFFLLCDRLSTKLTYICSIISHKNRIPTTVTLPLSWDIWPLVVFATWLLYGTSQRLGVSRLSPSFLFIRFLLFPPFLATPCWFLPK